MELQMRMDPSQRKLRSYSGMANTRRKCALQLPTFDGRLSSSDIHGLTITIQKLTGLARVSPCLDALLSVEGGQMEVWQRTMDQNPEMRFMLHSSPLSGQNTTLGLQIPHQSSWPRKHRRLREANPSRTWCWPNTTTSEMSSPRKPLTSSHHGRHGTMPLISHLGLNSLAPGCSPCPLQNRRSLTTSSGRTLRTAASIHPSPPCEPLCSSSKRRMLHFTLYSTIGRRLTSHSRTPPSPSSHMSSP